MVNSGQRKTILRAGIVQIREVDTHSLLHVCLFDHDDIGQPLRIEDFPNKISRNQFVHCVHYYFVPFRGKDSSSLLDRFFPRVYIKAMLDNVCWDTWHALMAPCKHVEVIVQEADNLFFRLWI